MSDQNPVCSGFQHAWRSHKPHDYMPCDCGAWYWRYDRVWVQPTGFCARCKQPIDDHADAAFCPAPRKQEAPPSAAA